MNNVTKDFDIWTKDISASTVLRSLPDAVVMTDPQMRIFYFNLAAEKLTGFKSHEALGMYCKDVLKTGICETECAIKRALDADKNIFNIETTMVSAIGQTIPILVSALLIKDATGNIFGYLYSFRDISVLKKVMSDLGISRAELTERNTELARTLEELARDITERKQAEKMLGKKSEEQTLLLDNTQTLIWYLTDAGTQGVVNKACADFFGKKREDLENKKLYDIMSSKEEAEVCIAGNKEVFENKVTIRTEEWARNAKGEKRLISITKTPKIGKNGNVEYVVCSAEDITERKRMEESLKDSEAQYRLLFNSITDAVYVHEVSVEKPGKFFAVNDSACRMLGYTMDEFLQMEVKDIDIPEQAEKTSSVHEKLFRDGYALLEGCHVAKDGRRIPVEINIQLFELQGKSMVLAVARDITERKRAENALLKLQEQLTQAQKMEAVGQLAGGIAHDFNNLMTGVLGSISLVKSLINRRDKVYEIIEDTEKAALRTRNLTQQLLTFSKGGLPIKKVVSIVELIKESARFALSGSNVTCEFSIPCDILPVEVDEGQVGQVMNNIIINAIRAMPDGGIIEIEFTNVTIDENNIMSCTGCSITWTEDRLYCARQESCPVLCKIVSQAEKGVSLGEGEYVRISIKDHGIGIAKQYLPKIFDPYFTTKQDGSGLGLATAYSIVKRHGGNIDVESEPGVGTTFYIYLPATREKLTPGITRKKIPRREKGNILVMDDKEVVRNAAKLMLNSIGYDVVLARDGNEAIAMYKKALQSGKPFDAVILDLTVPGGMGGKEAVKKVLEIDPNAKTIVSSGYSNDPVMSEFEKYGFVGLLEKPYRMEELRDMLLKVIETRS